MTTTLHFAKARPMRLDVYDIPVRGENESIELTVILI